MSVIESITAAASRILSGGKSRGGGGRGSSGGAAAAWDMFETVPEVGTYADWVSNAMSGATLYAGKRNPDGAVVPQPGSRAAELVSSIAGGPDGQSVMLGEFGVHLAVAGDCWLVIIPNPDSDVFNDDRWHVLSTEEVSVQRGKIKAVINGEEVEINEYNPEGPQPGPDDPVAMRVWKPSPRRHQDATSPVLRSLVVLEELRLLNAAVAAIARSRITGRGVLLVPAGTRFPAAPGQTQAEDSLLDTFIEVASTAIREPESAAATVPIVLEVPGDLINGVKWLQFGSEFDAMALQLRDEAIRRFATGADVPAEVLMGLGDASHWGAWAITAEALKMGVEPRLALVCEALTSEWLQPLLEAESAPDASEWVVWYDTAGLRSSSNKGATALEAFREDLISDVAARRELGFTEADAPTAAVPAARTEPAATEGTELPVSETEAPPNNGEMAAALSAVPNPAAANGSAVLDSFTAGADAALAEAVDGIVWAAKLVASRKLVLTPVVPRPARGSARELLATGQVHHRHAPTEAQVREYHLLDGAWLRVPQVARRYGLDPAALTAALDDYVTGLLVTGQPHTFEDVTRLIAQVRVAGVAA